jgi:hypothetical protein
MMIGVSAAFYVLPLCFTLASGVALLLPFTLLPAWRERKSILTLAWYTTMAVVGLAFIPFCAYWGLLGMRGRSRCYHDFVVPLKLRDEY